MTRMLWMVPMVLAVGIMGTRTALRARRISGGSQAGRDWWVLLPLAWLPAFCLVMSLFVTQG